MAEKFAYTQLRKHANTFTKAIVCGPKWGRTQNVVIPQTPRRPYKIHVTSTVRHTVVLSHCVRFSACGQKYYYYYYLSDTYSALQHYIIFAGSSFSAMPACGLLVPDKVAMCAPPPQFRSTMGDFSRSPLSHWCTQLRPAGCDAPTVSSSEWEWHLWHSYTAAYQKWHYTYTRPCE